MKVIRFFDDWMLSMRVNLERHAGKPRWQCEAVFENPADISPWSYPAVYRLDEGHWIMFYYADTSNSLCVAESVDGVSWSLPDLGGISTVVEPRYLNEVIGRHDHPTRKLPAGFVFEDCRDPVCRFKVLFLDGTDFENRICRIGLSKDGKRWEIQNADWNPRLPDPPNCIYYNVGIGKYCIALRPTRGNRRVALSETIDFKEYTSPRLALQPDRGDPPLAQHYGMPVYAAEDMYIGLLWILHHEDPNELRKGRNGKIDAQLSYSYDGLQWNRFIREPFIPLNDPGMPGSGCIYPSGVVELDEQLFIYSGSSRGEHAQYNGPMHMEKKEGDGAILLHTLRKDGWCYLEPDGGEGSLLTKAMVLNSCELSVNVQCPDGYARVRLADSVGNSYPGFDFENCTPFTGDSTRWVPQWSSGDFSQLVEKEARIGLELFNGRLYSIRADADRSISPTAVA